MSGTYRLVSWVTTAIGTSMDIALVLLAISALLGAATGLRFKALALVPIALLIALVSAAVLRVSGFGTGGGIVVIIGCLVLNQATYLLIQIGGLGYGDSNPSLDDVFDDVPRTGREQAVDNNYGHYNKRAPSRPSFPPEI